VRVDDPALAAGLRQALGQRLSVRMPVVRVPAVRMPSGRAPAGRLPVVGMPAVGVRVLDGDLFGDEALGEGVIGDDGLGDGVFGDDVLRQIEALSQTELVLPNGARLSFHPTPALVAIDVDTGAATGGHMAINREVLPGLARQIRLRNLSGAILLDFAGLPVRRRSALGPALAEALADDHGRPRLLGFTALGLAEIVRPRVHPPLHEMLAGPYAAGLAALRAIAAEAAADPSRMAALRTAPAVATALERDRAALADLARRTGRTLILRSDPSLQGTAWTMEEP
jgi:Ribonuclease G/E